MQQRRLEDTRLTKKFPLSFCDEGIHLPSPVTVHVAQEGKTGFGVITFREPVQRFQSLADLKAFLAEGVMNVPDSSAWMGTEPTLDALKSAALQLRKPGSAKTFDPLPDDLGLHGALCEVDQAIIDAQGKARPFDADKAAKPVFKFRIPKAPKQIKAPLADGGKKKKKNRVQLACNDGQGAFAGGGPGSFARRARRIVDCEDDQEIILDDDDEVISSPVCNACIVPRRTVSPFGECSCAWAPRHFPRVAASAANTSLARARSLA